MFRWGDMYKLTVEIKMHKKTSNNLAKLFEVFIEIVSQK
jgi:hypothetical protein